MTAPPACGNDPHHIVDSSQGIKQQLPALEKEAEGSGSVPATYATETKEAGVMRRRPSAVLLSTCSFLTCSLRPEPNRPGG
jgi:hypothetical protein